MTQQELQQAFEGRWRIKGNFGQINRNSATMSFDEFYEFIKGLCRDFFEAGILLSEKTATAATTPSRSRPGTTPIALRAESFFQQVHSPQFTAKYPPQLLQEFFSYWSEPNRSNTKMRFELQKTWDTSRRLATWARNDFHHYAANSQSTIEQQRADKLASILTD